MHGFAEKCVGVKKIKNSLYTRPMKTILLGFDSFDPMVFEEMASRSELPHLQKFFTQLKRPSQMGFQGQEELEEQLKGPGYL